MYVLLTRQFLLIFSLKKKIPFLCALDSLKKSKLTFPLGIAYSGGADSTILLHAASQLWPGQVRAIHVHHGLQDEGDNFACHCKRECAIIGVPLLIARVQCKNVKGQSPEEAARVARYRALASEAAIQGVNMVALGHHADDQVETLLLALSRGAGAPGLAGMPIKFERFGTVFVRPLICMNAENIRKELKEIGVAYLHDPSNDNLEYTRNKIRHRLLPILAEVFPHYRETFTRSARNMAMAQELLTQAAVELKEVVGSFPKITVLQSLSRASQGNVLRFWLKNDFGAIGSEAQMNELLNQIEHCTNRSKDIRMKIADGFIKRHGLVLKFSSSAPTI